MTPDEPERPEPAAPSQAREVLLRDGARVLVRQMRPEDEHLLADGFSRLSADSRRLRFLAAKPALSPSEVRYFASVDGTNHDAVGAIDGATGCGVGIARFVRLAPGSSTADVAVTVVDEWQRRGLGSILMDELIVRALRAGVETFVAEVAAENTGAHDFLLKAAPSRRKRLQAAVVDMELDLTRARAVRAAA